ncbi:MAG: hypothetical protein AAF399_21750, partial [Bacteroidota bacterium]
MKKQLLLLGLILGVLLASCFPLLAQGQEELPPRIKNIRVMDPLKYPGKAIRKKIDGMVKVEIEVD